MSMCVHNDQDRADDDDGPTAAPASRDGGRLGME